MTDLRLDSVSVRTNGSTIIDEVTLEVDTGEVVAIIGPSGAGKTTLLRVAATFEQPVNGSVNHNGTDMWSVSGDERLTLRRQISMVFQEPNLFDASVLRNVRYGQQVRQPWPERLTNRLGAIIGRQHESESATVWLRLVGLEDRVDAPVDALSTGEAQRVAMARALAIDPTFLLLDEPTANLDPRNTAVLESAIEAAAADDTGVMLATHDMAQARRIADRVAVILDGELTEIGTTEQIFEEPTDPRTGRFIEGELVY